MDITAGRAVAGVELVLTGRDLDGLVAPLEPRLEAPGFASTAWPALPTARVRFVGEAVAVVAGSTPYATLVYALLGLSSDAAVRVAETTNRTVAQLGASSTSEKTMPIDCAQSGSAV